MYIQSEPNNLASGIPIAAVSIHLNLFFLRIMMEHCFFIQISFMPKDKALAAAVDEIRNRFAALLKQTVSLADRVVRESALKSRQFFTPYTLDTEKMTSLFTGVPIDTSITAQEQSLHPENGRLILAGTEEKAKELSKAAYSLTAKLADFKKKLLLDVENCKAFTANFPMELHHMWEEADRYLKMLEKLETEENIMRLTNLSSDAIFWNHIMSDHSKFTANRLDPYEAGLIQTSLFYASEFESFANIAGRVQEWNGPGVELVMQNMSAAERLQDFQIQSTKGIMDCSIQSLILPIRSDHHIRETYFFMWLLNMAHKAA